MKTKLLLAWLLVFLLNSCATPQYLPEVEQLEVNRYGSHIRIRHKAANIIKGELIAIGSDNIVVLTDVSHKCIAVPLADIKNFRLRYAKPKHYGWSIPVFGAVSLVHGLLATITLPLNLIVTTYVTITGENAFTYNDRNMTYQKLKMFARFPQGVPPHIDLATIR